MGQYRDRSGNRPKAQAVLSQDGRVQKRKPQEQKVPQEVQEVSDLLAAAD